MNISEVKTPGKYTMTDYAGGPSDYNVKIVDGEVMVNPAHTKMWVEIYCMDNDSIWYKV